MSDNKSVRGCLIERKGKYYAVISYYVGGCRQQDTKSTGISVASHKKREAERMMGALVQAKEEALERLAQDRSKHSFADCFERWIEYKKDQVEATTAWGYKNRSKTIVEYFRKKNSKIEDLQPKDLLAYYEWALANGRRNLYNGNAQTGLSRRTVRDQAALIKCFLNDAVVQGIIKINPADKVKVPRVQEDNIKEKAVMDTEQSRAFLAYLKTEPIFEKLYCMTKVGLCYGLRRSELLGLRWNVIDFDKNEIEVNHTVVRSEHGAICRDNVKSRSSHRFLPLMDYIRDDLLDIKESQKRLGTYSEDGYVFKWEDGRRYDPDYITKLFRKAVIRSGKVPEDLTVHGLRHSCCTILRGNGWESEDVRNWLGHSDTEIMDKVYNHASRKQQNRHGDKPDRIFNK